MSNKEAEKMYNTIITKMNEIIAEYQKYVNHINSTHLEMPNVAPFNVANVVPPDVANVAPPDVANDAPPDVANVAPPDVANDAPPDVANDAPPDVANDDRPDMANYAPQAVANDADIANDGHMNDYLNCICHTQVRINSQTDPNKKYVLSIYSHMYKCACSCADFLYRQRFCKHLYYIMTHGDESNLNDEQLNVLRVVYDKGVKMMVEFHENVFPMKGDKYEVRSYTDENMFYVIKFNDNLFSCNCPHFTYRKSFCKHLQYLYDNSSLMMNKDHVKALETYYNGQMV